MLSDVETVVMMDHGASAVRINGELFESDDGFAMGSPTSAG